MSRAALRALAACLALLAASAAPAQQGDGLGGLVGSVVKNLGAVAENRDAIFGTYTDEQERAMGRASAAVLLGAAPLLPDPEVQTYVNRVGRWIALQSERPELEWRFGVLADDTFNAFATPGGYVLISSQLFVMLRSEAELAGVLAHEIAHVVARHHLRAWSNKARMALVADIAADAAGLDGLAASLVNGAKSLYASGLDQGDELEADRMGVVLAARAGYQPYGLRQVLSTMRAAEQDSSAFAFFLSTHPPTETRMQALDEAMTPELEAAGGAFPDQTLARLQSKLVSR